MGERSSGGVESAKRAEEPRRSTSHTRTLPAANRRRVSAEESAAAPCSVGMPLTIIGKAPNTIVLQDQ